MSYLQVALGTIEPSARDALLDVLKHKSTYLDLSNRYGIG